jgi:hypothetical protein
MFIQNIILFLILSKLLVALQSTDICIRNEKIKCELTHQNNLCGHKYCTISNETCEQLITLRNALNLNKYYNNNNNNNVKTYKNLIKQIRKCKVIPSNSIESNEICIKKKECSLVNKIIYPFGVVKFHHKIECKCDQFNYEYECDNNYCLLNESKCEKFKLTKSYLSSHLDYCKHENVLLKKEYQSIFKKK